jgi:hypothetical protein
MMDTTTQTIINNFRAEDPMVENPAFMAMLAATEPPVDWAYAVWDELLANLRHPNNHQRSRASQLLANLAKSDPELRMLKDFDALLNVTRDERFVTARHCLQALWKVGAAGPAQQQLLLSGLERRYFECIAEKNCTLIRYDIIQSLRSLYDAVNDETISAKALAWIAAEEDLKYRKKYAGVWKGIGS